MPRTRRQRVEPTADWQQLRLLSQFAEQLTYQPIRPVVLFGQSPAERARVTRAPERTLYRQVARFQTQGMASLFAPPPQQQQGLSAEIREAIRGLKAERRRCLVIDSRCRDQDTTGLSNHRLTAREGLNGRATHRDM